jgi:hypothetical protein
METITYVPGHLDPPQIKWCGQTFHANVPKEILGDSAGSQQERLNHGLIEAARGNRHFTVGGAKKKRDAGSLPTNDEEYRAYVVKWLQDPFEHVEDMIARLARDRDLWQMCEVGSNDFEYISTLFMPKLYELARGDDMNELQVSAVWARHGFNVLPW